MIPASPSCPSATPTARYAELLPCATGLPAYSLAEAKSAVSTGAEVIYLGWIMAGSIKGYAAAARRYRVRAVLDWYSARK